MHTVPVKVSYRDKATNQNVQLGTVDAPRFDSITEADEYFTAKGEKVLDYVHAASDIALQNSHRAANRPDKPQTTSNVSKFKKLSPEQQAKLLEGLE